MENECNSHRGWLLLAAHTYWELMEKYIMDDYDCPVKPEGREEENGGSLALSYCLYKNTAWNLLSCYTTILKCGCKQRFWH